MATDSFSFHTNGYLKLNRHIVTDPRAVRSMEIPGEEFCMEDLVTILLASEGTPGGSLDQMTKLELNRSISFQFIPSHSSEIDFSHIACIMLYHVGSLGHTKDRLQKSGRLAWHGRETRGPEGTAEGTWGQQNDMNLKATSFSWNNLDFTLDVLVGPIFLVDVLVWNNLDLSLGLVAFRLV